MMLKKLIAAGWLIMATALFLYSFTQIDLGLTFNKASVFQGVQQSFQYIGYFNRNLSALLFTGIIIFLFVLYIITLNNVRKDIFKRKELWAIIFSVSVILSIAYTAFSYDIFNYIFDAKIVTVYQENPYEKKALDFPQDPMLGFMHWTHRTYPYGPVWLGLTIPLSYLGMNYFLITYYLFKLMALASFLGTVYFMEKILRATQKEHTQIGLAFFALNPLILVEFLVSGHNDITMIFFVTVSLYLVIKEKHILSFASLLISIGVKFITAFMLPVWGFITYYKIKKKKINYQRVWSVVFLLMIIPVIAASLRTNFQPWYLIYLLFPAAFLTTKKYFFIPMGVLSFVSLFNYLPFLYIGNWDQPIPLIINTLNTAAVIVAAILALFFILQDKKKL